MEKPSLVDLGLTAREGFRQSAFWLYINPALLNQLIASSFERNRMCSGCLKALRLVHAHTSKVRISTGGFRQPFA